MSDPDVIIIYIHKNDMHMTGAHWTGSEWKYSNWVILPKSDLNEFIQWRMEQGAAVLDARLSANLKHPGMGAAVPIILAQGISIKRAVDAAIQLHQAILDS
jgi:hypothetical protein